MHAVCVVSVIFIFSVDWFRPWFLLLLVDCSVQTFRDMCTFSIKNIYTFRTLMCKSASCCMRLIHWSIILSLGLTDNESQKVNKSLRKEWEFIRKKQLMNENKDRWTQTESERGTDRRREKGDKEERKGDGKRTWEKIGLSWWRGRSEACPEGFTQPGD